MTEIHVAVGSLVVVLNLLAGLFGGVAWLRKEASVPFWYLLRAAQAAVFAQALLGALLLFAGHEAEAEIHYLYGILPLLVSFLAEGARTGAAERELRDVDFESLDGEAQQAYALAIVRREMGIMAVSCWVIFFVALRAAGTSPLV